jgi:hypothetical protein
MLDKRHSFNISAEEIADIRSALWRKTQMLETAVSSFYFCKTEKCLKKKNIIQRFGMRDW